MRASAASCNVFLLLFDAIGLTGNEVFHSGVEELSSMRKDDAEADEYVQTSRQGFQCSGSLLVTFIGADVSLPIMNFTDTTVKMRANPQ